MDKSSASTMALDGTWVNHGHSYGGKKLDQGHLFNPRMNAHQSDHWGMGDLRGSRTPVTAHLMPSITHLSGSCDDETERLIANPRVSRGLE